MRLDVRDKVVLVTGGGDGIGRAAALELARRGARVAVLDRDEVAAKAVAAELTHALAVTADVTDREGMAHAVQQVVEHFGRLDVVVANAGITPPPATLRLADPEDFDHVLAVNVTGVLNTVQPAVDRLVEHEGHVVVVASCAAFSPPVGGAAYMVSKAALEVLARAFRLELAPHGVTVTTAYFGFVETQLARATLDETPIGRQLEALMPPLLGKRISAGDAGRVIADAVASRKSTTTAPKAWVPLGLLRGVLTPALDAVLVRAPLVHRIIRELEQAVLESR